MPARKDRIYLALYARGGQPKMAGLEDTYHWGIVTGPQLDIRDDHRDFSGKMFHAREKMAYVNGVVQSSWQFEERQISMTPTSMVLVHVVIGKVINAKRLESVLRSTPIKGGEPGWNCVVWVREGLEALEKDGKALGTSNTDWNTVRNTAMRYVEGKKAQHRFDGKGNFDMSKIATWDMLEGKESVP